MIPLVRTSATILLVGTLTPAVTAEARPHEPPAAAQPVAEPSGIDRIVRDAAALRPLFHAESTLAFLDAAAALPRIPPRTLLVNKETRAWYTAESAGSLPADARSALTQRPADEEFYYTTKYGSPLAYARALELIANEPHSAPPGEGEHPFAGKKILDYGYGTIGHLRILASLGAEAIGVDVDPMLPVLYSQPGDQGRIALAPGASGGPSSTVGSLRIINGLFPGGTGVRESVGLGYDLVLSKNTLKNGYIHPAQPVDKRMLVDLSVPEPEFVQAMFDALKPGGLFMIYNICPAPSKEGEPYKPWADGRSPFTREQFEHAGFRVLAFDVDDSEFVYRMWPIFGYDEGNPKFREDLFTHYTLVQRPADRP